LKVNKFNNSYYQVTTINIYLLHIYFSTTNLLHIFYCIYSFQLRTTWLYIRTTCFF